ncbi:CHAT domain-containing protein [Aquimarina megaterium]|uniref:CHAT domain-containing protein n=1 Tax=Aquimarina megaterium TaxID=1443666 RepID=UPI000471A19B|nr:CHAT domain-containing protein [Aquimarina megaterium]
MKKLLIFHLCFLISSSVFSLQENKAYQKGVAAYIQYNYKEALLHFELASDYFLEKDDIKNYLKSQLYISNIEIYKNNFPSALETINVSIKNYTSSTIKNDSLWGELMNTKAVIHRKDGYTVKALQVSDEILKEQLKKSALPKYNLVRTYTVRSNILWTIGRFDEAIQLIKKTLNFSEYSISHLNRAELLNNLGSAYLLKGDFNEAHNYYNKAYQLKLENKANLYDLATTTFNIGVVNEALGDYNMAIEFYKKSATYDLRNQGEEVGFITDIYTAISGIYAKKNDLEKAEEYIDKALKKAVIIYGENHLNTANIQAWYVRYLKLKEEYAISLDFDKKALRVREKSYGVYNWFPIQNLTSIADTYVKLAEYVEAEKYYKEALRRSKKMDSKFQEAECYQGIGDMYMKQKKYKKATDFYTKAFVNFSDHFYENHRYVLKSELLLAEALFKQGNHKNALGIIQKHFALYAKGEHDFPLLMVEAIHLNNCIALTEYTNSNTIRSIEESYENMDLMIQNIREIKKEYTTDRSLINVGHKNPDYFDKAIELCYVLFQSTQQKKYLEKAFQFSEINRNSALVTGIKDKQFKKIAGVPDSLLQQENMLKRKLSSIRTSLHTQTDSFKVDSTMSLRLDYSMKLEDLLHKIERDYPEYYRLKYADHTIKVSQLQKEYLNTNTTLVEYFVGEKDLYVFVINNDTIDFKRLPIINELTKSIKELRKQILNQQDLKENSKRIFTALLKNLDLKENLILVTDNVLNYVPFEVLHTGKGYMLKEYAISYVGSATVLKALTERSLKTAKGMKWSGFAPKYENDNSFASSYAEIKSVSKMMKGKAYLDEEASVKNFIAETANSSILHLATHAEIDKKNAMMNKLIFSENGNKNILMASDIYGLSIPSEMIVLSACNTGFGKLEKGEGVMSMSRAFHYAGAKSTVMSLWKVPDKETSVIMNYFYKSLKKGYAKDRALQQAKLQYLGSVKDNALKHPFYWAGFVVSGNTESLAQNFVHWWIMILVLILVLIFRKKLIKFFK